MREKRPHMDENFELLMKGELCGRKGAEIDLSFIFEGKESNLRIPKQFISLLGNYLSEQLILNYPFCLN